MTSGVSMMQMWPAGNWGSPDTVSFCGLYINTVVMKLSPEILGAS